MEILSNTAIQLVTGYAQMPHLSMTCRYLTSVSSHFTFLLLNLIEAVKAIACQNVLEVSIVRDLKIN